MPGVPGPLLRQFPASALQSVHQSVLDGRRLFGGIPWCDRESIALRGHVVGVTASVEGPPLFRHLDPSEGLEGFDVTLDGALAVGEHFDDLLLEGLGVAVLICKAGNCPVGHLHRGIGETGSEQRVLDDVWNVPQRGRASGSSKCRIMACLLMLP